MSGQGLTVDRMLVRVGYHRSDGLTTYDEATQVS